MIPSSTYFQGDNINNIVWIIEVIRVMRVAIVEVLSCNDTSNWFFVSQL